MDQVERNICPRCGTSLYFSTLASVMIHVKTVSTTCPIKEEEE
jgi:hypothetical protein